MTAPIPQDGSGPTLGQIIAALGAPEPLTLAAIPPELLDQALTTAGVSRSHFAYHAERLAEPDMLLLAVPVGTDLAIPVGEHRHAGFVLLADADHAATAAQNRSRRAGFPNARVLIHDTNEDDEDYNEHVRWGGDETPNPDDWDAPDVDWAYPCAADGRMYGYRTEAIREFIARDYGPEVAAQALAKFDATSN